MTVIISLPHSKMIIMTADSRKTTKLTRVNFELQPISQSIEYTTMTKVFPVPGAGCATLWGDDVTRAEHGFPRYLGEHRSTVESIEDLRILVERYLEDDLQAEQDGADVGFHVGGFAPDGTPKLYHVFWGWDRPRPIGQEPSYHSSESTHALALYNGRNDYVDPVVKLLVELQEQVGVLIFDENAVQRVVLADFITRYVSRFTPDVGGEIHTVLIRPDNQFLHIRNPSGAILPRNQLGKILADWMP